MTRCPRFPLLLVALLWMGGGVWGQVDMRFPEDSKGRIGYPEFLALEIDGSLHSPVIVKEYA